MRTVFIVIKHEIITILQKRSFWITAFLFPLLIVGINVGVPLLIGSSVGTSSARIPSVGTSKQTTPIGYVDQAGLIEWIPGDVPPGLLREYRDEAAAQAAVKAGEVGKYVLIPEDYLQTGHLILVQRDIRPLDSTPEALFKYILAANLTGSDNLAALFSQPVPLVEAHSLAPLQSASGNSSLNYLVPMAILFVFFFLLIMSSGFMLQSVSREKENCTMEVLLVSLMPRELMLGKILGLSVIALLQMIIWLMGGLLVLGSGSELFGITKAFNLPSGFVVWALLYFLLGYLLYSSLMGAIGAMAPTARESGHFTFLVLAPLMIPVMFNSVFINAPNSPLALALSLFPLSAPTTMITRIAATRVPFWQIAVSLAGLTVTTYFIVNLSASLFRADTLLSRTTIRWKRVSALLFDKDADA